MPSAPPRFEYRVFASPGALADLHARLRAEMHEAELEQRDEVYLVGPRDDCNVKLRDDAIEVKVLRETRDGLERWEPEEPVPFPVSGAWVRERLAALLGQRAIDAPLAEYATRDALQREVLAAAPGIPAAHVYKERERFEQADALAELSRLRLLDLRSGSASSCDTVAFESAHLESARAGVARLGLARRPNTSYVRFLRDRLGRAGSAR